MFILYFRIFRIWNRLFFFRLFFRSLSITIFHVHIVSSFFVVPCSVPISFRFSHFPLARFIQCNANIWVHYFRKLMNPSLMIETSNRTFIVVHGSKCVHQCEPVWFSVSGFVYRWYTVEERERYIRRKKNPPDRNCQTQRADVTMRFHLVLVWKQMGQKELTLWNIKNAKVNENENQWNDKAKKCEDRCDEKKLSENEFYILFAMSFVWMMVVA